MIFGFHPKKGPSQIIRGENQKNMNETTKNLHILIFASTLNPPFFDPCDKKPSQKNSDTFGRLLDVPQKISKNISKKGPSPKKNVPKNSDTFGRDDAETDGFGLSSLTGTCGTARSMGPRHDVTFTPQEIGP